jgi:predicted nucleic acid-binding protein
LQPRSKKRKQRAVVDTNVVVAGISGFRKQYVPGRIPSADLLHRWAVEEHFVWLYSEDVLAEYKEVLKRLRVRSAAIGTFINIIRELGEPVEIRYSDEISPDPKDDAFCLCAEGGTGGHHFHTQPQGLPAGPVEGEGNRAPSHARPS